MVQTRLYLWDIILVKQAMITIKWKIIEKKINKKHKPIKTLLYSKGKKTK